MAIDKKKTEQMQTALFLQYLGSHLTCCGSDKPAIDPERFKRIVKKMLPKPDSNGKG